MQIACDNITNGRKAGTVARFDCHSCDSSVTVRGRNGMFRCAGCNTQTFVRAGSWTGKDNAMAEVSRAIRDGRLPSARGLACKDCSGPAIEYEHRDYNKPLAVDPICRGCNLRRGPAKPVLGAIANIVRRGGVPYHSKHQALRLFVVMGLPAAALESYPKKLTNARWRRLLPVIRTEQR